MAHALVAEEGVFVLCPAHVHALPSRCFRRPRLFSQASSSCAKTGAGACAAAGRRSLPRRPGRRCCAGDRRERPGLRATATREEGGDGERCFDVSVL